MKNTINLIDIIKKSDLPEPEKEEWEAIIKNSPKVFTESLEVVLSNFPGQIEWFNGIYQRKKQAFDALLKDKDKGQAVLKEIYQEEKDRLEELAEKE